MSESTLPLPGLSPVGEKAVIARFDGGQLSSDAGVLVLREIERGLDVAGRLAGCLTDPRLAGRVEHGLAEIVRFRMLMIAAGYEDGNDADSLRRDPVFKMALERSPSAADLCSQSTISRLENLPDVRALLRMGHALVDLYCGSFRRVPQRIVLDIDDTFDSVHGGQQLRLFNAYHDNYGFQPIVVFDGDGRIVAAMLRPAKRPNGREIRALVRRVVRRIRANWPRVDILVRADSHYCCPEVLHWCRQNRVDYLLGLAGTLPLKRHVATLEASTAARFAAAHSGDKVRRFKELYDAASTWSRVERIVARVEAGPDGVDSRFVVTSLRHGSGRWLYQDLYCRRGQAENHIKAWKAHLAADRTSCSRATANQFRLFLHAGAYWLLWSMRALMPRRSAWRVAQFDTLRLRLVKIAARIIEMKTRIAVQLPAACPVQAILRLLIQRIPRLVT
jgi:hypothetical protein